MTDDTLGFRTKAYEKWLAGSMLELVRDIVGEDTELPRESEISYRTTDETPSPYAHLVHVPFITSRIKDRLPTDEETISRDNKIFLHAVLSEIAISYDAWYSQLDEVAHSSYRNEISLLFYQIMGRLLEDLPENCVSPQDFSRWYTAVRYAMQDTHSSECLPLYFCVPKSAVDAVLSSRTAVPAASTPVKPTTYRNVTKELVSAFVRKCFNDIKDKHSGLSDPRILDRYHTQFHTLYVWLCKFFAYNYVWNGLMGVFGTDIDKAFDYINKRIFEEVDKIARHVSHREREVEEGEYEDTSSATAGVQKLRREAVKAIFYTTTRASVALWDSNNDRDLTNIFNLRLTSAPPAFTGEGAVEGTFYESIGKAMEHIMVSKNNVKYMKADRTIQSLLGSDILSIFSPLGGVKITPTTASKIGDLAGTYFNELVTQLKRIVSKTDHDQLKPGYWVNSDVPSVDSYVIDLVEIGVLASKNSADYKKGIEKLQKQIARREAGESFGDTEEDEEESSSSAEKTQSSTEATVADE